MIYADGYVHSKMYMNRQDVQILVIRLYFLLDAVHVPDYVSPSSGATL